MAPHEVQFHGTCGHDHDGFQLSVQRSRGPSRNARNMSCCIFNAEILTLPIAALFYQGLTLSRDLMCGFLLLRSVSVPGKASSGLSTLSSCTSWWCTWFWASVRMTCVLEVLMAYGAKSVGLPQQLEEDGSCFSQSRARYVFKDTFCHVKKAWQRQSTPQHP